MEGTIVPDSQTKQYTQAFLQVRWEMDIGGDLLSVAITGFGLRLLSQMAQNTLGKNIIVSPLGPFQALYVLGFASDKQTRQKIWESLKISDIDDDVLDASLVRLGSRFATTDSHSQLSLSSVLQVGKSVSANALLSDLAQRWGFDFIGEEEIGDDAMPLWAKEKTRGLLPASLPTPSAHKMDLLNVAYFCGIWKSGFSPVNTINRLFYRPGHLPVMIPLMRQAGIDTTQIHRGKQYDAVRIPYTYEKGQEWSLQVILPHEKFLAGKDYLTSFLKQFSLKDLDECQSNYRSALVDLMVPRFTMSQTHNLRAQLTQIGLGIAFKVSDLAQNVLSFQDIRQQIHIDINEKGRKEMDPFIICGSYESMPEPERPPVEKFYVNRPFLFLLTEDRSGLPLFAGVIYHPGEK